MHWTWHDLFSEDFPDVRLVPTVFVSHERIVTASGGTAAADLMLHLIGRAHGADLATEVADQMVYNAVRDGTATQRVSLQARHGMRSPQLVRAVEVMSANLEDPLSPSVIASSLGISSRQLERLFGRYLHTSPQQYYMSLRLQRARNLLVQTEQSVLEVAIASGFKSASHFSRVYRNRFGTSPSAQRPNLVFRV